MLEAHIGGGRHVCVGGGGGGWHHIIEEGLYGSTGGSEKAGPLCFRGRHSWCLHWRPPCTPPSPRPEPLALRSYDASVLARPCRSTGRPLRRARLHGRSLSGRGGSGPRCRLSPRWPRPVSFGAPCTPRGGPLLVGVRVCVCGGSGHCTMARGTQLRDWGCDRTRAPARTLTHPVLGLTSIPTGPSLNDRGGGGAGRLFLRGKTKGIKEAGNVRPILGTHFFFNPPPLSPLPSPWG